MQIVEKKVTELKAYEKNPRKNDKAVAPVAESIKEFGFKVPIIIDKDNVIVAGHTRLKAAKRLKLKTVPCIVADDLTPDQIKAFRLADNKVSEFSEWDIDLLTSELKEIDFDMALFGFEEQIKEIEGVSNNYSLKDLFGWNTFSVLDGRMAEWQDRKKEWLSLGIKSEIGRDDNLMNSPKVKEYVSGTCSHFAPSTSIFDPVICELMYKWFNITGGSILDPFAGGSVRGVVAHKLGYKYYGNELREEQVEANLANVKQIFNENEDMPVYTIGDSLDIVNIVKNKKFDMIFSCPPYADLEVYSNLKEDISNMEYKQFIGVYNNIIKEAVSLLKDDRFAVFVVGDVRDKSGAYYDFISDTKKAFINNGCFLYNEIIKIDPNGTAGIRAKKTFATRKVIKVHQNILVFYKGNLNNIKKNFKEIKQASLEYELF